MLPQRKQRPPRLCFHSQCQQWLCRVQSVPPWLSQISSRCVWPIQPTATLAGRFSICSSVELFSGEGYSGHLESNLLATTLVTTTAQVDGELSSKSVNGLQIALLQSWIPSVGSLATRARKRRWYVLYLSMHSANFLRRQANVPREGTTERSEIWFLSSLSRWKDEYN